MARFALRIAEELREDNKNRKDFSMLKAVEDLESLLESNGYGVSYNSKMLHRNLEKKKQREEQFLNNIKLFKKINQDEIEGLGSFDRNKDIGDFRKAKCHSKENAILKNYDELREQAFKDLNFKISD